MERHGLRASARARSRATCCKLMNASVKVHTPSEDEMTRNGKVRYCKLFMENLRAAVNQVLATAGEAARVTTRAVAKLNLMMA